MVKVLEAGQPLGDETEVMPKTRAFRKLEKMLIPISPEIDYEKELAEARNERYG